MGKESIKYVALLVLTLLFLGIAAAPASADNATAGVAMATGVNVTINATSATGINASVNTVAGANITVSFNNSNTTLGTTWYINATNLGVSINGSGSPNGTIASNGTFTLNSSVPTSWFNVTVMNAGNSSENATLTGFFFVQEINLGTAGTYGILSSTFTRNGGVTAITGDLGYTTLSGAGTHTVTNGATAIPAPAQAGTDQTVALATLASQTCTFTFAVGAIDLAADITHGPITVYTPGVYCIDGAVDIGTAGINLSGNGTYIFRSTGALNVVANSIVTLTNGASASNVFWTPIATTLNANAIFAGTVIQTSSPITVNANTIWTGRALTFANTVTTDTATITGPANISASYGVNLTNISALVNTTKAGVNATYYLNITNNGTSADYYNITVTNPNNAYYAATNISTTAVLAPNASQLFTLNVTNITTGTVYVNVTATSNNNISVFGFINTTTIVTAGGPLMTALPTGYGPSCGGYASDTCPYFTLNVMVTDNGTGVNSSNVTVNVSRWNNTGILYMNPNGTSWPNYNFSLNVTVNNIVRGTYNATVTAYDNYSMSNTTNLSVEAHIQMGLSVIGYNSSKTYPAYPTYVSMFYNNSPVVMIINTTDATQYSNITVYFGGVDGSASVEYNNSGVLLPDGTNYTYRITHNLSTIPTNDVRTAWINATFTPPGGVPITIPQMAALIVVSNVNPRDMGMGLGGITTNWSDIPDYTNASLTFEAVNATNNYKVATLRFNDPINLTNYATAQNLSLLGQKLSIAGSSINLSGAADALIAFNKSANLTIYNLTTFTTSPAIFADGVLIALPDSSSGGAASDISWNQTAYSLTLNVSHWTSYSWGTFGINLTNVSALNATTNTSTNATYAFILQNNGTEADSYNLTIDNPDFASVAALNRTGNITLAANAIQTLLLNVTNTTAGTYRVNVTATSVNFSNRTASINTTTTIPLSSGTNLTRISGLTQSVTVSTNATYTFRIQNNGSANDNYTISVSNPNTASYGVNITSPVNNIAPGATQIFTLNVSNASAGTFPVNITVNSTNNATKLAYFNTTTIVLSGSIPGSVNLGTAGDFVILSKSGITNVPTSAITGNIGTSPITGAAITGLSCSEVTGTIYTVDATGPACRIVDTSRLTAAVSDMQTAYTDAAGRAPNVTELGAGNLVDLTLAPGVYKWGTGVTIPTDITLNGSSTDVWIFQIAGTLGISSGKQVILSGGAQASNIYWQVAGATTLGTTSVFNGNILDMTNIAIQTGATLNGRALAQTAVTLDMNAVSTPTSSVYNGTLRGTYIKSGTGIGVSGATVNITNTTSVIVTTDTSGFYSVSLSPGTYTINVSRTGYSSNSTTATVASNTTTTVPTISLSPNTVTVTANRTVGSADPVLGENVSFNLTVVNIGENATFLVTNTSTNVTIVTNVTTPSPLLLNTSTSTGYVVVTVNNTYFGSWPVTITISNSSQSKSASVTLTAIMRDSSANYTNISGNSVTNSTVTGATLENTTVQNGANVSGNSTSISNSTITGSGTSITDFSVIRGTYTESNIDNSTIGNATVDSSNLTGSTIGLNASVSNSTLIGATVENSTLTNVNVTSTSTITNVANLTNITLGGVTVTGDASYDYEGKISAGTGWATYLNINFTKVYADVRISQLVIDQIADQSIGSNTSTSINDTAMNFSMTVNFTKTMVINISETGISPDGTGLSSGTQVGNFLVIRSNDTTTANVTNYTLRLYFDTVPSTYTGGVAIYYYNTSAPTPAWEKLTTTASGTEGGRYYVEAILNHMSTFALLGTTSTGGGSTGGSSGTSTGGGGVVSGESFDNIAKSESYDKDLIANTPITYTFKTLELGVYEIAFTGKENENGITLRVEALKGTSKQVTVPAPGTVYKNVNLIAGTSRMKEALVRFRVENSWLGSNSFAGSDVKMLRWDGSQWTQLETAQTTKDDTYTYYEAKTTAFSPFAISGIKGGVLVPPTATPAGVASGTPFMPTGTGTPAPSPTKKVPAFEVVLAIAILSMAYMLGRKRR